MAGRGRIDVDERCPVAPGDVLAGKFVMERVLGAGGMGVVMSAMHAQLRERVAIKFLVNPREDAADRFDRELRIVARLHGEHIVRVLDAGKTDRGVPFLVMEYLRGQTLSDVLREGGPLDPTRAADFLLQVCDGLAEPHAAGIVHRDVKPSNLFLVERPDGSPLIKLIDFGIAKGDALGDDGELTRTHALLGSPSYASPEQLTLPRSVDARSDIWSCGVTLFRMVTGQMPFAGETLAHLCMNVVGESAPLARAIRSEVTPAMERVLSRCLEKDPKKRFATVAELAEALEPCASAAGRGTARRVAEILARGTLASAGDDAREPRGAHDEEASREASTSTGTASTSAPPETAARTLTSRSSVETRSEAPERKRAWRMAAPIAGASVAAALLVALVAHRDRPASAAVVASSPPTMAAAPSAPIAPSPPSPEPPTTAPVIAVAAPPPPTPKRPAAQPRSRARAEARAAAASAIVCPGDPRCAR